MYLDYWNLRRLPFENVANPAFFYPSSMHEEALERLTYTISQGKGAAMILGGVGCGKTMLCRVLMDKLARERYEVVSMTNPALPPLSFLQTVMVLFKGSQENSHSKGRIWQSLEEQLQKNLDQGSGSVLIIDEAQVIKDGRTLEELRMLLNLQTPDKFLLNVILLGQLELEQQIDRVEPLVQRIPIRYRLLPLPIEDTIHYIRHRLRVAGCEDPLFSGEALNAIFKKTNGIPREVNNLCDRSLLAAYIEEQEMVSHDMVEKAWKDLH